MENLDQRLDKLWAAYRESFADPEPGGGFMPGVWEKIEARRSVAWRVRHMARTFLGATAVVFTLMMCLFVAAERRTPQTPRETYLDALASNPASDSIMDAIHAEAGEAGQR
jgi:hypothetical protein